jgi:hypothetical protein
LIKEFNIKEDAERHIDKIYGDLLLKLSHKICVMNKYILVSQFIDTNLEMFTELKEIKNDLNVTDLRDLPETNDEE